MDDPIQNIKMILLEQSLEMNEFKKENNVVPFEVYEFLLETTLWMADRCIIANEMLYEYEKMFTTK